MLRWLNEKIDTMAPSFIIDNMEVGGGFKTVKGLELKEVSLVNMHLDKRCDGNLKKGKVKG